MPSPGDRKEWVGPVLAAGPSANAIVAAIRELNPEAEVIDRGSYLRVQAPERCLVTRACIERHSRAPFRFPIDLEAVMPSFKGCFSLSEEEARWEWRR